MDHGRSGADAPSGHSRAEPEEVSVVPTSVPNAVTLPPHIAEQVLRMGRVDWGAVGPKPDAEHVSDFADSLAITREHFGLKGPRYLSGLYLSGTDTVLCHTGTSPNSPTNAQALAGVWNWLVEQASGTEARQRQDRETGLGPKGDGPTAAGGDAQESTP